MKTAVLGLLFIDTYLLVHNLHGIQIWGSSLGTQYETQVRDATEDGGGPS